MAIDNGIIQSPSLEAISNTSNPRHPYLYSSYSKEWSGDELKNLF